MKVKKVSRFLALLSLLSVFLLSGCDMALMDPKGQIGLEQRSIILIATGLMLLVVIPVIVMTLVFAWKYRASNTKATYAPDWAHSNKIEAVVWTVPLLIVAVLAYVTWTSSHALDPRKPIESEHPPITIQVVAMDWKWLFIYPELGIATVNQISFPVDVPVQFKITSETVMNSFFIPRLGSQLYAMAGMENTLHLIANEQGTYQGQSSNYSGHGFSGMKFDVLVTTQQGFEQWVQKVKQSPNVLNQVDYDHLIQPSQNNPVEYFSSVQTGLYHSIINKFMPDMTMPDMTMPKGHNMNSMSGE